MLLRQQLPNLPCSAFANLDHGSLDAADNAGARRTVGDDITLTGGADGSGAAAISEMLHSARTAAIRSRMRCKGSRTLHFEN